MNTTKLKHAIQILLCLVISCSWLSAAPPFTGTIFLDPDIIFPSDPTTYLELEDAGQDDRLMFDRRPAAFVTYNAFLFNAHYLGDKSIEIQVNPEFETVEAARVEALRFAPVIGRLPNVLLKDVETVWIHKGNNPFGGGNNNLLIHTEQADDYISDGILEETLVHEASHTSLDAEHAESDGWIATQNADPDFISTYARDNSTREDVAETFLVWLAVRHRPDRISDSLKETIEATIPNRLEYFDEQDLDLFPIIIPEKAPKLKEFNLNLNRLDFYLKWESRLASLYDVESSINLKDWSVLKAGIESQGETTETSEELPESYDQIFFRIKETGDS
ncbi:hypothetical protein F7C95_04365 [Opitutia bacterium ISCC 51]|nr:hypothetical protein F7C95_04365 [Opitutae bacterium ISCC 51]QXD29211.1 hypothetical protein GA003_04345 [Opitutae bacterium ISCC 52]